MMKGVKRIYRDEKATELNEMLVDILDELETEHEGLTEELMDLTMNHEEQREKTFLEMLENAGDIQEIVTVKNQLKLLDTIIPRIKNTVFKDCEEITKEHSTNRQRMTPTEVREWLGEYVKPYILNGVTRQSEIAVMVKLDASALSRRVLKGYGVKWAEYCIKIRDGIY